MEKIDTKKLFQITEAAHACGLSRSTLMRQEEKGLLKPAYIAPDSGRRYYDNHNVARILQIETFKAMGFGTEEIAGYFVRGGEAEGLLAVLEERLHSLQRSGEEMRLRATAVTLPECRVLSVLYCGDYSNVDEAWLRLGREANARGLTPAAPPRVLGIVAPYTGREIETRRYCSRLVLPVAPEE